MLQRWRARVAELRLETLALALAVRDPRVPWYAKLLAIVVVAYALSPIDLIPDFIPVAGYLDDLLLVPAGLLLVRRMVPQAVLDNSRQRARSLTIGRGWRIGGALIVGTMWLAGAILTAAIVYRFVR